jgi:hypothetical protein
MSKRAEELAHQIRAWAMNPASTKLYDESVALIDSELRKERERCAAKIPHSAGAYWVPDYGNVNGAAYDLWVAGGRVSNCLNIVSDKLEKHYKQLRKAILADKEE